MSAPRRIATPIIWDKLEGLTPLAERYPLPVTPTQQAPYRCGDKLYITYIALKVKCELTRTDKRCYCTRVKVFTAPTNRRA